MFRSALALLILAATAIAAPAQEPSVVSLANADLIQGSKGDSNTGFLDLRAGLIVEDVQLAEGLEALRNASSVPLGFSPTRMRDEGPVSCICEDVRVGDALERLLSDTDFRFVEARGGILIERIPASTGQVPPFDGRLARLEAPRPPTLRQPLTVQNPAPRGLGQTGVVEGTIVDQGTGRPLSGTQVSIVGTNLGTLTAQDGSFQISAVPTGEAEVRAERIGYMTVTHTVTVQAGETVTVDFVLTERVLSLDGLVVTGTAGQARQREVGNSIVQIDVADLAEAPVDFESILQARGAGISVTQASGSAGSASHIRLRGISSLSQGNQPLVYVDGVRLQAGGYPMNRPAVGFEGRGANTHASSLNDISPADIARVEVIKGPAATTLYGTEAAAGVIQIFTHRGVEGAALWSFQMEQGINQLRKFAPEPEPYFRVDEVARTGWRQKYGASVSGGTEGFRYFLSGGWESNEGVLPLDLEEKTSLRGNFNLEVTPRLQVEWNTALALADIQNTAAGNNVGGVTSIATRGPRGSIFGPTWREDIYKTFDWEITNAHEHLVTGMTAHFNPTERFSNRLSVGVDRLHADQRNIRPFGHILAPEGILGNTQWYKTTTTFDYVGTMSWELAQGLRSQWSVGAQYVSDDEARTDAYSEGLAGPGIPTISSGAVKEGFEERLRVASGGFFGQALFDLRDRYFLTLGLRLDGNSAFGRDFGLQPYPKVSASYVISDEPWWSPTWGDVKLRGAYGHAGKAPGAFDAVRVWEPVGFRGAAGFVPANIGNPDLGPERSAELEAGFDAGLFERLTVDFTYYNRTTSDALFPVRHIPSDGMMVVSGDGVAGSQLMNVGKVRNSGVEVTVMGDLIQRDQLVWTAGASLSTNKSRTIDLGGAPEFNVAGGRIIKGQPAPVRVGTLLLNPDEIAEPEYETNHVFGPTYPTRIWNLHSSVQLPGAIRLSARGELQTGFYMSGALSTSAARQGLAWCDADEGGNGAYQAIEEGRIDELTAFDRAYCDAASFPSQFPVVPADFFRLRDVSLQLPLPFQDLGRWRDATMTVSARNWFGWTHRDFLHFDPETIGRQTPDSAGRSMAENIPPPKTLTMSLSVRF